MTTTTTANHDDAVMNDEDRTNGGDFCTDPVPVAPTTTNRTNSDYLIRRNRLPANNDAHVAQVVTGLTSAMSPAERRRRKFLQAARLPSRKQFSKKELDENFDDAKDAKKHCDDHDDQQQPPPQYRLNRSLYATSATVPWGDDDDATTTAARPKKEQTGGYWPVLCRSCARQSLGSLIQSYIYWSYQTRHFFMVLLSLTAVFYAIVVMFAVLIDVAGLIQPTCIYVGSLDNYKEAGHYFIDALAISWTTFSTVGYGLTGPALSNVNRCILLNMFTAMEAFLGVLFASFAGAVILGKTMRYNAIASVVWSDPMVLRYGQGAIVAETQASNEDAKNGEDDRNDEDEIPFPVLEFRVANSAFAREECEIAQTRVNVWASILAEDASTKVKDATKKSAQRQRLKGMGMLGKGIGSLGKKTVDNSGGNMKAAGKKVHSGMSRVPAAGKEVGGTMPHHAVKALRSPASSVDHTVRRGLSESGLGSSEQSADSSIFAIPERGGPTNEPPQTSEYVDSDLPDREAKGALSKSQKDVDARQARAGAVQDYLALEDESVGTSCRHVAMLEDPTNDSGLSPSTIYSKIKLENDSHPLFKRTWILRHRLDVDSPLLDSIAHDLIAANDNSFPDALNSWQALKRHVRFQEIMVTLNGMDNITGNTVYGQKTYSLQDLTIGWRFANTLIRKSSGSVGVDLSLLNDVLEQRGGGGEPLVDSMFSNTSSFDDLEVQPVQSVGESLDATFKY